MRLPKPSSASLPTIACSGTPRLARPRPDLARRACPAASARRACPRRSRTARDARMRSVEVERVEHERRARPRAPRRTAPTARRKARPPRRSSARRAGPSGSVCASSSSALLKPRDHRVVSALLRPEDLRRVLQRRPHVAQHHDLRPADPAGLPRSPRSLPRRRRSSPTRRRRRGSPPRPACAAAAISSPSRRWSRPGVRLLADQRRAHSPSPSRRSPSHRPRPARTRSSPARPAAPAPWPATSSPPKLRQQRIQRPLAAIGHRTQVRRHQPRPLQPPPDRPRHLRSAERPLELVRGHEHGPLGDSHAPKPERVRPL